MSGGSNLLSGPGFGKETGLTLSGPSVKTSGSPQLEASSKLGPQELENHDQVLDDERLQDDGGAERRGTAWTTTKITSQASGKACLSLVKFRLTTFWPIVLK